MAAVDRAVTEIGAARAKLAMALKASTAQGDPLVPVIEAQVAVVDAMAEVAEALRGTLYPITEAQLKQMQAGAVRQMGALLLRQYALLNRWHILASVVAAVAIGGIGFAGGMFTAPALRCVDQQGGRICYHWLIPPTK
jgi:CO dehydrogenase/acetyl-CoA synthase gamma subunit (corrinoid Fe-S protein)